MSDRTSLEPEIELAGARAVQAFASGVRSSVRNNATAYGFSITITVAFALVSASHPDSETPLPILLFATAAAASFFVVEAFDPASSSGCRTWRIPDA